MGATIVAMIDQLEHLVLQEHQVRRVVQVVVLRVQEVAPKAEEEEETNNQFFTIQENILLDAIASRYPFIPCI